jgi:hypothetical protein
MNLKEEMNKEAFFGEETQNHARLINIEDAIEIAEEYANFKMKIILGHFQRKCDNIEQSLNVLDKNEQLIMELKDESI